MSNFKQQILGDFLGVWTQAAPTFTNFSYVNSNDQVEVVFQVPDDAGAGTITITRLGYQLNSVTGTSPVMQLSLQGVDASGNPDGTIKASANAKATFTPSGSGTWNWVNLNSSYTASRGEWLAWVLSYSSGTINASNRPIIGYAGGALGAAHPYAIGNVATVRTRIGATLPVWGFGSAGKAFGFPVQSFTATTFSTTNERALRFMIPQSACASYKVVGIRSHLVVPAAGKSVKFILYDGTTALQTCTWDTDFVASTGTRTCCFYFQDATLATLVAGKEYRLGVQPQDAANNIALHQMDFASNADMEAMAGGLDWYLSTRAAGGATAWTDTVTSRPYMDLILGDVTAPSPGVIIATG